MVVKSLFRKKDS